MSNRITLYGCAPEPLIHYLKALGVLRLVAEQFDPHTRGAWRGDAFVLETSKTEDEIMDFFLNKYQPTPIVAPWNGSSGFYLKDKKQRAMLEVLCSVGDLRFEPYRRTVEAAQAIVGERIGQPKEEEKAEMLRQARKSFPDPAVDWLDAAFVLGQDKPEYPPLLGSGGNDGRLDFTVNFIARLLSVLPEFLSSEKRPKEKLKQSENQLRAALFASQVAQMEKAAVGQFHPAGAGGANASQGVGGDSFVNPWDFILALEGSLLLASATVRQLIAGARTRASFPFTVSNSTVGYGTAADEKVRAELWLPLWSRSTSYTEVAHIFKEGRVQFSQQKKSVRTGFDFARAVAELGVDRGIEAFERYAFIERNGQANLAVPLGRFEVRERPRAQLIHQLDRWLDKFKRAVADSKTPPRFVLAQRRIDEAIFRLCESNSEDHLRDVLIALGAAEAELANGERFRKDKGLRSLAGMKLNWVSKCNDNSDEFKLAAAIASICGAKGRYSIRENIEPVSVTEEGIGWAERPVRVVWSAGQLEDSLAAILHRRSIDARAQNISHPALKSRRFTSLYAINAFLNRETDDERIEELLRGLILLDWHKGDRDFEPKTTTRRQPSALPRAYALLKLLFLPEGVFQRNEKSEPIHIKHEPSIVPLLRAGRVSDALQIAGQRLVASGLAPAANEFHYDNAESARLAAALLIPIDEPSIRALADMILREKTEDH